jgi:dihydroflavonol-4-reductase
MRCLVTGASGFVGANLVHELVARGHSVRALLRRGSDRRGLAGAVYETVEGDLTEPSSWGRALGGCDWCFHVAASYHLWLSDYAPMYRANVEGTRQVLRLAAQAGCRRIVYTSTVGCLAVPRCSDGPGTPVDETATASLDRMTNPYKRSKWQAEQVALELAREGVPVVIVNPSAPIGPLDVKPTPTGQVLVDFLNRRLPGYVDTGLNWVHVRDVAVGHILAAERGRIGERYILGHADGNWTMAQTLSVWAELSGLPAPRWRVPYTLALTAAGVGEALSRLTGRPPRAPLAGVRMARYRMWFNPAKAIRELGLPQTPPTDAFREAIDWFRSHGYLGCVSPTSDPVPVAAGSTDRPAI